MIAVPAPESAGLPIPAVTTETAVWVPSDGGMLSKTQRRRETGPYESTVPAVLVDWEPVWTGELSADVDDATRALADFDTYALRTLGAEDPAVGPMSSILLRTESASSSQIEHLTVSARQLALAELDEGSGANALTVTGNVRAMEAAIELSNRLDLDSVLAMHRELLRRQRGYEQYAGRLREVVVWIGRGGPRTADFVGPQPERVPGALADLFAFAARDDLPPLVQIAVAHAQFETVHPFVDGNGRTGRAFVQAMLRGKELSSHTTVPLSAGLLAEIDAYFDALTAFRAGDAEPIVRRFAAASRFAAVTGRELVETLALIVEEDEQKLAGVRSHALARRLLPKLVGQPVVNAKYVKRELGIGDASAQRALDLLAERGVLEERTGYRRNRVWQHTGILNALDAYAERARRPYATHG
ncbi:Fic family protein [Agromyces seonyuensis]|uniref:Fic family protein n=1 Tax=Agromyces seonyuensis TaxID=2662446 RepID=A0A6I4NWY6_9MICO|nr:Fic family protein [Agromyces seonyuensis]MWB97005.1 Fic family protein [Agromyces seonyuensis]